jgi:hypothetical protein
MELEDKTLEGPFVLIFRGAGVPLPFYFPVPPQRTRVTHPSRTAVHQTLEDNFLDDFSGKRSIVSQVHLSGTFGYHSRVGGFGIPKFGSLHLLELEKAYETYNALSRQVKKTLNARTEYICLPRLYFWRISIDSLQVEMQSQDPLLYYYNIVFRRLADYLSPVGPDLSAIVPQSVGQAIGALF